MMKYLHTCLIVKDLARMMDFYREVLGYEPLGAPLDLKGTDVDQLTGVPGSHLIGQHLALPEDRERRLTLEFFTFAPQGPENEQAINALGLRHLAYEVDNVPQTLAKILDCGGSLAGEVVLRKRTDGNYLVAYARDCEGNIIELQSKE